MDAQDALGAIKSLLGGVLDSSRKQGAAGQRNQQPNEASSDSASAFPGQTRADASSSSYDGFLPGSAHRKPPVHRQRDFDPAVFEDCTWELTLGQDVTRALCPRSLVPRDLVSPVLQVMYELGLGHSHKSMERLHCIPPLDVHGHAIKPANWDLKVFVAVNEGASSPADPECGVAVLWERAVDVSAAPVGAGADPVIQEVVRVWAISISPDPAMRVLELITAMKRVVASHTRGAQGSVAIPIRPVGERITAGGKVTPLSYAAVDFDDGQGRLIYSPGDPDPESFGVLRFFTLDAASATTILKIRDGDKSIRGVFDFNRRMPFMFRITAHETSIVFAEKQKILLLLGRSGTGKTTVMLHRLLQLFKSHWEDEVVSPARDAFEHDDAVAIFHKLVAAAATACITDAALVREHDGDSGPLTGRVRAEGENDGGARVKPLQQVVITRNMKLLEESASAAHEYKIAGAHVVVRRKFKRDDSECKPCSEETHCLLPFPVALDQPQQQHGGADGGAASSLQSLQFKRFVPAKMTAPTDVPAHAWPLFLSFDEFLRIVDASLEGERCFEMPAHDAAGIGTVASISPGQGRNTSQGSNAAGAGRGLAASSQAVSTKAAQWTAGRSLVTFDAFKHDIWKGIRPSSSGGSRLTNEQEEVKGYSAAVIWNEINSFIKGSNEAVARGSPITREQYLAFPKGRVRHSKAIRGVIYDCYEAYATVLDGQGRDSSGPRYDNADIVLRLHKRLSHFGGPRPDIAWTHVLRNIPIDQLFIDEVQDFTMAELTLQMRLCKDPNQVFIAGDTAQAISKGVAFRFDDVKEGLYEWTRTVFKKQGAIATGATEALIGGGSKGGGATSKQHKKATGLLQGANQMGGQASEASVSAHLSLVPAPSIDVPTLTKFVVNYRSHSGVLLPAASFVAALSELSPAAIDSVRPDRGVFNGPKTQIVLPRNLNEILSIIGGPSWRRGRRIQMGANQVIIVRDQQSARELPPELRRGNIIRTIEEVKGLKMDDVILWNFFRDSPCEREWRVLIWHLNEKSRKAAESSASNNSLASSSDEQFNAPSDLPHIGPSARPLAFNPSEHKQLEWELKHLYVGLTRARVNCMIVDLGGSRADLASLHAVAGKASVAPSHGIASASAGAAGALDAGDHSDWPRTAVFEYLQRQGLVEPVVDGWAEDVSGTGHNAMGQQIVAFAKVSDDIEGKLPLAREFHAQARQESAAGNMHDAAAAYHDAAARYSDLDLDKPGDASLCRGMAISIDASLWDAAANDVQQSIRDVMGAASSERADKQAKRGTAQATKGDGEAKRKQQLASLAERLEKYRSNCKKTALAALQELLLAVQHAQAEQQRASKLDSSLVSLEQEAGSAAVALSRMLPAELADLAAAKFAPGPATAADA